MISDQALLDFAQARLLTRFGSHVHLHALLIIGSFAYPQFARPNSDIDLIAVRSDGVAEDDSLHLDQVQFDDQRRLAELRTFTAKGFYEYVMSCDIAQSYAFVRGYRFVLPMPAAQHIVELAIGRYFSDASRMWAEMQAVGLNTHLAHVQFLMTDCRHQLLSATVSNDALLRTLRVAEVTKDFISQMWIALLMQKYVDTDLGRRTSVDPRSELLQEVGLLRVFMGLRGGRMVDGNKYTKSADVGQLMQEIRDCSGNGVRALLDGLETFFSRRFGRQLFLF